MFLDCVLAFCFLVYLFVVFYLVCFGCLSVCLLDWLIDCQRVSVFLFLFSVSMFVSYSDYAIHFR